MTTATVAGIVIDYIASMEAVVAAGRNLINRERWVEIWDRHLDRTYVYPSITDAVALQTAFTALDAQQAGGVTG